MGNYGEIFIEMDKPLFDNVTYKSGQCGDIQKNENERNDDYNHKKYNSIIKVIRVKADVFEINRDIK